MTTYLGKRCSFGLPRVLFVNCRQFMYLVFPFWFWGQDVGSDCISSDHCLSFYFSVRWLLLAKVSPVEYAFKHGTYHNFSHLRGHDSCPHHYTLEMSWYTDHCHRWTFPQSHNPLKISKIPIKWAMNIWAENAETHFGYLSRFTVDVLAKSVLTLLSGFYSQNTNLLPPKPKSTFRHLKRGIQDFHRKYVLVPADKAANNVVVVWLLHYINTLKQELRPTKRLLKKRSL